MHEFHFSFFYSRKKLFDELSNGFKCQHNVRQYPDKSFIAYTDIGLISATVRMESDYNSDDGFGRELNEESLHDEEHPSYLHSNQDRQQGIVD